MAAAMTVARAGHVMAKRCGVIAVISRALTRHSVSLHTVAQSSRLSHCKTAYLFSAAAAACSASAMLRFTSLSVGFSMVLVTF